MKTLVIYSGGMDSFTLLHHTIHGNKMFRDGRAKMPNLPQPEYSVQAVSFNYGQRHLKELEYARMVANKLEIDHTIIDLRALTPHLNNSALTGGGPVPEGHYAEANMKQTVVPGRNTIMLAIAMGIAENRGLNRVVYGAHAGDHTIYPDCRPPFVDSFRKTAYFATDGKVNIHAPFLSLDKGAILRIGLELGLDYGESWTCYKGEAHPCGVCGACVERAEAFQLNNVFDPLLPVGR